MPIFPIIMAAALSVHAPVTDRAAVVEAENSWSNAEVSGDTGFLQAFLTDDYESVGANGAVSTKSDLIVGAARRAKAHPGMVAKALPPTSTIQIFGDTALVRHHSTDHVSVDLLQKRNGRWVAWFSQHTNLPASAA